MRHIYIYVCLCVSAFMVMTHDRINSKLTLCTNEYALMVHLFIFCFRLICFFFYFQIYNVYRFMCFDIYYLDLF